MAKTTKEISVFIDESGSFDPDRSSSRSYLVCMVFHDQDIDLSKEIASLDASLANMGLKSDQCIHAGPLIRREKEYSEMSREERRGVFTRMMGFLRKINVTYKCFRVDKSLIGSRQDIHDPLLQQIVQFLISNAAEFNSYDKLKVYYDNGQSDVSLILRDAFALFSSKIEFVPNVTPEKYKLFQVADMIATLELVRLKLETEGRISDAEKEFFLSIQNLKKNFLKPTARKRHE